MSELVHNNTERPVGDDIDYGQGSGNQASHNVPTNPSIGSQATPMIPANPDANYW